MDIITMLTSYIDVGAVLLGLVITQLVKWLLPTPPGGKTFDVGPLAYRLLPLVSLVVGAATVIIKDGLWTPAMNLDEAVIKGLVSGAVASYLFRSAKVMFFEPTTTGAAAKPPEVPK